MFDALESTKHRSPISFLMIIALSAILAGCGGGGGGGGTPPSAPSGLVAAAGNGQVSLSWNASTGATSYNVKRSTTTGGPYATVSSPTTNSYTDTDLTNGTTYYYVVTAVNSAGASRNIVTTVTPSATGSRTAAITITDNASDSPQTSSLTGTVLAPSPVASFSPFSLAFGNQNVGTRSASQAVTLSNTGTSTLTITSIAATGDFAETDNCDGSVLPGASCKINVTFTPSASGPRKGSVRVADNAAGSPQLIIVTGVGEAAALSASSLSFGNQKIGTGSPPQTVTLSNSSAVTMNVWQIAIIGDSAADFSETQNCGKTLGAGSGCTLSVTFTPSEGGSRSASLLVSNDGGGSPQAVALSGSGVTGSAAAWVNVEVLSNRHPISPFVYGGSFPKDAATITDSGTTFVRWGGNATSRYNWKLFTQNAAHDWYYEDFTFGALNDSADADSEQFVRDVIAAGSNPLMTMVMLPWVAKSAETPGAPPTGNGHWSFSVAKYGAQCAVDQYNSDAGNGYVLNANCNSSNATPVTGNDPTDANVAIKDTNAGGDPVGTVYRNEWATALAVDFGSAPHFYDMDNEIDIWSGSHRDIHPNPTTDEELRDTYLAEARALKGWDSQAIRFGPVSCCWYFYWNPAAPNDKAIHGNIDFLPWWLNELYWSDLVAGTRSLDVFDIHAYTESNTGGLTLAQQRALALRVLRDWWDPTYVSESWFGTNNVLSTDPVYNIAFRLPRLRAVANTNYPGTPLSATEWNVAFAGETDFSTALADADAYGILGRERLYAAARWTAADPAAPAYQALKLYRNYDGAHHGFGTLSVSATHSADPDLFSAYAALDSAGTTLSVIVINKDPANATQAEFALDGFTPGQFKTYTISPSSPTSIVASGPQAWAGTQTFASYTATLLVIAGSQTTPPSAEWDLNPESIMVPASGTVTLAPKLISGSGTVKLSAIQFDPGIASMSITNPTVTSGQNGSITVTAGSMPGFYHFTITGTDGAGVAQKQGGWIVVSYPAATLAKQGDNQSGTHGTNLTLTVNLNPGQSGGSATGASILFATDAGSLSQRIVPTDSSGNASVTLTLPASPGTVHVTAEGPYGLGHPVATFTETSQ